MIQDNPLFTKESLDRATRTLSHAISDLLEGSDDGSNVKNQEKAGRELRQAEWVLATIIDHVFDYHPYTWYLAEGDGPDYKAFRARFLANPKAVLDRSITYAKNNFEVLETVNRDHHLIKTIYRKVEDEQYVVTVLNAVRENLDVFVALLKEPKLVTDLGKPTADEIKTLIESIRKIKNLAWGRNSGVQDMEQAFQFSQMLEMFLNPLYMSWQVYEYGWHSDFWEEGEPMFTYMMFEVRAEEIINTLINVLESQSPFAQLEHNGAITKGLLKVYRHVLTQDWKRKM